MLSIGVILMFDKLKKLPVIEMVSIGLLFFIMLFYNVVFVIMLGNILFEDSSQNIINNFFIEGFDIIICLPIAIQTIISICIYLILYKVSLNKFFIHIIYGLKFYTIVRRLLYFLLMFISPVFLVSISSFILPVILLGICYSLAFPLILLYAYWGLENRLPHRMKKIYKGINTLLSIVLPFFVAGFVYYFNNQSSSADTRVLELALYIVVVLIGTLLLLTEKSKILLEKIKKYKWHSFLLWVSVIYATLWGLRNEWVTYYVLYISAVLLLMLIFEKPLLSWRAKNEELHRETEEYYKSKIQQ